MPMYKCLDEAIQHNETKPCKVAGCTLHRSRVSGYCRYHSNQLQKNGHPEHRAIRSTDCQGTLEKVQAVINQNQDHKGIMLGHKFFRDWMSTPHRQGYPHRQPELFQRLAEHGVSEFDLLSLSASLYVMHLNQHYKILSQKHFIYQLGYLVLSYIPHQGKITGQTKRDVGQFIHDNLKTLFATIFEAIMRKEMKAEMKDQAFQSPLSIN